MTLTYLIGNKDSYSRILRMSWYYHWGKRQSMRLHPDQSSPGRCSGFSIQPEIVNYKLLLACAVSKQRLSRAI